jgi:hypothetical protein
MLQTPRYNGVGLVDVPSAVEVLMPPNTLQLVTHACFALLCLTFPPSSSAASQHSRHRLPHTSVCNAVSSAASTLVWQSPPSSDAPSSLAAAAAAAAAANTCRPYFPPTATNETNAVRFGPASNCDSPCVNASTDPPGSCGGALANSLYRLPPLAPGVSPAPADGTPPPVVVPPAGGGGGVTPPVIPSSPVPAGQLSSLNLTSLGTC